jgi:hypothetical protein
MFFLWLLVCRTNLLYVFNKLLGRRKDKQLTLMSGMTKQALKLFYH